MTTKLKLLFGLLVICAACSKDKETATGLKFTVLRKGDGIKLDSGKHLVLNMTFKDGNDSVWNDTRKKGIPALIQVQTPVPTEDGVVQAIMMMSKGDSITFKIDAMKLFRNTFRAALPPGVDSTSQFTFNIGLADVLTEEGVQKLQNEIVARQNEEYAKQQEKQLVIDIDIIDKHLQEKGIMAEKTASGLRYVITQPGKGEMAKPGQSASINYSGYLLNGKFFDSSIAEVARQNGAFNEARPYAPFTVSVAGGEVIRGWDEIMQLMNKGSKLTVYIPSTMAYGAQKRSEEIVENSILVFDMEMVDIK